jgi:hypothetical protein
MIARLVVLAIALGGAWVIVHLWERRRPSWVGFPPGITVITGPDCGLCGPAVAAFRRAGIEPMVVDVAAVGNAVYRSLPTALVVDGGGRILAARSGRLAVSEAAALAALAV